MVETPLAEPRKDSPPVTAETSGFDQTHEQILARYKDKLPPPNPNLKLVLVIPSLAELTNDNFWRFLRSLALQQNVNLEDVEVLDVVNNTSQLAKAATSLTMGPNGDGPQTREAILFGENQDHLYVLDQLQSAITQTRQGVSLQEATRNAVSQMRERGIEITDHEANVFSLAVGKRVTLLGVDASSPQYALELDEQNDSPTGIADNIGGHLAYHLLNQVGRTRTGIIDFIDGDCFLSSHYIAQLLERTRHDINEKVFVKPIQTEVVEIPKRIEQIPHKGHRLAALIDYLSESLVGFRLFYLNAARSNMESRIGYASFNRHQIAVRAEVFREVNGYPTHGGDSNSDFIFSRRLFSRRPTEVEFLPDTYIYLSDRGRPEAIDGNLRGEFSGHGHPLIEIREIRERFNQINQTMIKSLLFLDEEMANGPSAQFYRHLRSQYFRRESLRRRFFVQNAQKLIGAITQVYLTDKAGSVVDIIKKLEDKTEIGPGFLGRREIDFMAANPLLVEAITSAVDLIETYPSIVNELQAPSADTASEANIPVLVTHFFERYLPEYFLSPSDHEPEYNGETLNQLVSQGEQVNLRDYVHIANAAYHAAAVHRVE